jgi:type IV pilus assembly protein PilM
MANGTRPKIACELGADRVIAARAAERHDAVEIYSLRSLPAGALGPSLNPGNVGDRTAVRDVLANALATVSGGAKDVIAVLPDAAVRINLLDFDRLPDRYEEAAALVRFRLRKSLPFDMEKASLSFDVTRVNGMSHVVAAVAPHSVVEEYESLFTDEGYNAGIVLPSGLAMLGNIEGERPAMVVKVDATTITVAIVDQRQLRLIRVLENAAGANVSGEQLSSEVYPSAVFFEDTYHAKVENVFVGGIAPIGQVGPALEAHTEARVHELVSGRHVEAGESAARSALAGVVGALIGAV